MNEKPTPQPVDIHVGKRVRMRRILVGLTQSKLAQALGITFQQVQKYESGVNRIGSSRLYHISQILNVPVAYFFDEMSNEVSKGSTILQSGFEASFDASRMETKETINLVNNYYGIKDKVVRRKLYNLVKSMV